jgi:glucokinase
MASTGASGRGRDLRGGIDLGGTKIQAVVVEARGSVVGQDRQATPLEGGADGVVAAMATAMRNAAKAAGVPTAELAGVGVGAPGAIDTAAGTVAQPPNLPWTEAFPLGPKLARSLGCAVFVDNDVRVATTAEFALGAGRDYRSLLGVFWGTGVGGGIILNGEPWHGRGAAGEIGHTIVHPGGAVCGCGRRGHLEAYAGRGNMEAAARRKIKAGTKSVLVKITEERGIGRMTSGVWARALEHGDKLAQHLIDRAVDALGIGIASAATLLDVEAVIIGGGLGVRLGQPYVDRIAELVRPQVFVRDRPPAIHLAALGDLGGAMGASLLVERAATARASA